MAHIETVTAIESYRDHCDDRVHVITHDDRTVIVVADGAGGVGSGDLAAESVVLEIESGYNVSKWGNQQRW
ncbi:MAG: protein phosphatase 2C domain-containing protein [Planctomycetota bacterium]